MISVPNIEKTSEDPAASSHDPKSPRAEAEYRSKVDQLFPESPNSWMTKLENFTKYVPRQSIARFLARYEIFRMLQDVHGSIIECGVRYGGGLMAWAQFSAICEPYNFQRRIIGFDTFTGFPVIAEADVAGDISEKSSYMRVGGLACPEAYEDLQNWIELYNQNRYLNHIPKVELVKGDFEMTCPVFLKENAHLVISCLYIDFDIYQPTKVALEILLPRIPRGGIIVFDELNEPTWPGESVAVLELDLIRSLKIKRFPFQPSISYAVIGE